MTLRHSLEGGDPFYVIKKQRQIDSRLALLNRIPSGKFNRASGNDETKSLNQQHWRIGAARHKLPHSMQDWLLKRL